VSVRDTLEDLGAKLTNSAAAGRARDWWTSDGAARYVTRAVAVFFGFVAMFVVTGVLMRNTRPPMGVFVYGAIVGLVYALVAFGLILIYRANRIINFAMAEMGAAPAILAVLLMKHHHVPYVIALPLAVVAGVVAGALTELLVIRRLYKAPRLILSVATIGVGLIFAALQFYMPKWIAGKFLDPTPPKTPFSGMEIKIGGSHSHAWWIRALALQSYKYITANHIVIVIATALIGLGLTLFFRYSDIGIAVRASAENADRAALLGIPVKRVSTAVWMIASGMAALGVFLRIPVTGIPVGVAIGPEALVYALAAAVIARMESFSIALLAGIGIGILEQSLYFFSRDPALTSAMMLPLLLVVMLLQRRLRSRGLDTGVSTWQMAREFRPIPPELRDLPVVLWTRFAIGAVILVTAIVLPHFLNVFRLETASIVLINGIVAVSLVILTGWAGQISLGQWGFAAIGAGVAGSMTARLHADFFVCIVAAGLVGAIVAVIIGLPALRIQGLYLAVTTLAFAITAQTYLISPKYFRSILPQAHTTAIQRPMLYGRFDLQRLSANGNEHYYWLMLIMLGLALASARALRRSRAGRVLMASRDNERGAQSYGINIAKARLTAFAISGFWAALAGALFVFHQESIDNLSFDPSKSVLLLIMVVIGGLTSLPGAILGTLWIGVLQYGQLGANAQLFASGFGVLVLLMFFPGGLAQLFYGARDGFLRWVADRHQIRVPSLVADVREEQTADSEADVLMRAADSVAHGHRAHVVLPDEHVVAVTCPQCGDAVSLDAVLEHPHFVPVMATPNGESIPEAVPVGAEGPPGVDVIETVPTPRRPRRKRTDT
jgi:branched-chain amino acid transport system permease protein